LRKWYARSRIVVATAATTLAPACRRARGARGGPAIRIRAARQDDRQMIHAALTTHVM